MTAVTLARTGTELRRAVAEARAGWSHGAWAAAAALALAALVPFLSLPGVRIDSLADTVYLAVAATGLGLTVGAAGLPHFPPAREAVADEARKDGVDLAPGGGPEVPDAAGDSPLEVVAGLLAAGQQPQHGRLGRR